MIDLMNVCSICSRKTLQNSYTVLCQCCQRKIHRNCITLSHDEFLLIQNCTTWFCKLCNDSIFPFNHIEDDYEFTMTLDQFMNGTLIQRAEFQHPDSMIFDPFEINEDQIVEYNGELDPDGNYFNQFSHQLNKNSNYHNEDSFNNYIKRNYYEGGNISFIHSNIRSIPANLTAFVSYMSNINCDFSVIGFSETWLNSSTIDTYGIDGYSHVGLVRESGKGGGVSLFVCDKMVYYEMSELTMMCDYIECVFIKINYLDYKLIVGVVYRPPNSNMVDFDDSMHDILEKIAHHPCYIMGDFNLDLLKHELHRPTERFLDTMYANSYIPLINRPTRVTRLQNCQNCQ